MMLRKRQAELIKKLSAEKQTHQSNIEKLKKEKIRISR